MSYTKGGFMGRANEIPTEETRFAYAKNVMMTMLKTIFEASRADAAARGADYTQYWDFDEAFVNGLDSSETETSYSFNDLGTEAADVFALTTRDDLTMDSRVVVDCRGGYTGDYPSLGTLLRGQQGEALYIATCSGWYIRTADNGQGASSYGLPIYAHNLNGYGSDNANYAAASKSSVLIWYNAHSGASLGDGCYTPNRSGFLSGVNPAYWHCGWGWGGADTNGSSYYYNSSMYNSITTRTFFALCKEDILLFGLSTNPGSTSYYPKVVMLGKTLIDDLAVDGDTDTDGVFTYDTSNNAHDSDVPSSTGVLGYQYLTNMYGSCSIKDEGTVKFHSGTGLSNSLSKCATILPAMNVAVSNRSNGFPVTPVAVHVGCTTTPSTSNTLAGNYSTLKGYIRGDVMKIVSGFNLSVKTTLMSGSYIVLGTLGASSYSAWSALDGGNRMLIGWDLSNNIVI